MDGALQKSLGPENVVKKEPVMGAEDFGRFSLERTIPSCMIWLGAVEPEKVERSRKDGTPLPSLHSALFAPMAEPTVKTGVKATVSVVLDLMK